MNIPLVFSILRRESTRTVQVALAMVTMLVAAPAINLPDAMAKADSPPRIRETQFSETQSESLVGPSEETGFFLPELLPEASDPEAMSRTKEEPIGIVPAEEAIFVDEFYDSGYGNPCYGESRQPLVAGNCWQQLFRAPRQYPVQFIPQGVIYRAYLANAKQSRMRSVWHEDVDEGSVWDITLGGQVGLLRRGSTGNRRPTGFQIDIEGSSQLRLDRDNDEDLDSTDYRFGIPLSWGNEVYQMKFGYYHISSHVADEYLSNHAGFKRLNFVRETIVWGHSYYLNPELRVYGEVGVAFLRDVSKPWEFQLGVDYSPACCTGTRGVPFAAFNWHLREELGYDGNIVAQVGWAWRNSPASGLVRTGLEYYYGHDDQFSFFQNSQHKVGFGVWYDF